jgi:hypothetical protein
MSQDSRREEEQAKGWAEHTVVASLPRLLPGAPNRHAPLSQVSEPHTLIGLGAQPIAAPVRPRQDSEPRAELAVVPLALAEEPRTVVGRAPSRATAEQLLARYTALAAASAPDDASSERLALPLRHSWLSRVATLARDDFGRAPRIVRLLVPALPLLAAATTFLDVDPAAPALSRAVAVAATPRAVRPEVMPPPPSALPISSVTIAKRPGHTLASDAADAAARGDRTQAIAIYAQLAREQPREPAYASAARILMRDEARVRPPSGE